jgi:hypothetical protein
MDSIKPIFKFLRIPFSFQDSPKELWDMVFQINARRINKWISINSHDGFKLTLKYWQPPMFTTPRVGYLFKGIKIA